MKLVQPKNTKIKISELGEERTFVSGNKNWRIDFAEVDGVMFKVGTKVCWQDPDSRKKYAGKIQWLIIVDDGRVEVSIDNPNIGRLDVDQLKIRK